MRFTYQRSTTDLLAAVAIASVVAFVAILCFVAARDPVIRPLLTALVAGMGVAVLILYRQLGKAARSLRASEARAQHVASHDEVTQLPNKTLLLERVHDLLKSDSSGCSLVCIGLDRFDETVEALGAQSGDEVLQEMAIRLTEFGQPTDTIARIRHDTFALLLAGCETGVAVQIAENAVRRLAEPYVASDGKAFISCSAGVTGVTRGFDQTAEALRQAHLALAHARTQGGARVSLFDVSMDHAPKDRKYLESELRSALARGALTLVYQPQVNSKGVIFGVEALARWHSPGRGDISPAVFIPLAETCGLSDAIGLFVLRQAFIDARRWPHLKVAVNLSISQIRNGNLLEDIRGLIAETGATARNIELEITEGVFLEEGNDVFETLAGLRRMGFSIALDDFGTGYSSLAYLRRFPVDKIKIDRSFVSQLGMRPESSAIIRAIVDLADALELRVLAEGVENRAQAERLAEVGCHLYQGFHFSPGVTPETVDQIVAAGARMAA